jgi:formate dehydrogenase subunit delta
MDTEKLAYMANQIGKFFQSQGLTEQVAGVEDHILKFWDPRMRRALVAALADGSVQLAPNVREAVENIGARAPG